PEIIVIPLKQAAFVQRFNLPEKTIVFLRLTDKLDSRLMKAIEEKNNQLIDPQTGEKASVATRIRYPREVMAQSLSMMGNGLKDALVHGRTALLASVVKAGTPILIAGGTGNNLDTLAIIQPGYRTDFSDAHVLRKICAPYDK
ncbi:MAG: hypothetical protein K8S56_09625, partial [Candidatus Cloacimonetes bacterium]|nr:hypothetical protein [Candidatus Cloacimonadota bacterium]